MQALTENHSVASGFSLLSHTVDNYVKLHSRRSCLVFIFLWEPCYTYMSWWTCCHLFHFKQKVSGNLWFSSCSNIGSVSTILWYPNKLCYFLRLSWNFFGGISHLPNSEMTKNLYVCYSVILRFCDRIVCVTLNMSSFLCLSVFQSAPNFVQMFLNSIP